MIKKFKIFESPDNIYFSKFLSDPKLSWQDKDARAFGYHKKDFMLHKGYHSSRWKQDYPGRIWLNSKIISFWEYPENKKKLRKIITDIENRIKQLIWNEGWQIEVPWNGKYKIIPLEDYEGVEDRSEDELKQQHVLSPLLKTEKSKGWKPKKGPSLELRQKMYQENMITQFRHYLLESISFDKNFLIDLIENKKGFVRMKRMKEKYIDYLNRIDKFSEDNQTIEKKELTQIKNALDKLYGAYYGQTKEEKTEKDDELKQIAKNKGVSPYAYENPDPAIRALGNIFNYSMNDAKRILERFKDVKLSDEEQTFFDKYYPDLEKWVDLNDRIEEIRKILNPTAQERKAKQLKEIKGRLNPKIKNAIDEIAENFRKVIEKSEKSSYEKSLERKREEYGDRVPYNATRERRFHWGGINDRLYQKDPNSPKYSYSYDYVLVPNYQDIINKMAENVSYEIIAKFKGKMYDKIGGMVSDIDKGFEVEVIGGGWTYNDIYFKFEDGSRFSIRNQIVSKVNQQGTFFYTYPTTFHDAYLPNGEKISNPNEYNVKKAFNDYYK